MDHKYDLIVKSKDGKSLFLTYRIHKEVAIKRELTRKDLRWVQWDRPLNGEILQ